MNIIFDPLCVLLFRLKMKKFWITSVLTGTSQTREHSEMISMQSHRKLKYHIACSLYAYIDQIM